MKNLLVDICEENGYTTARNMVGITLDMILDIIISGDSIIQVIRYKTGCAKGTITRFLKRTFPDRDPIHDKHILKFLLHKRNLRKCSSCNDILNEDEFYKNSSATDGLSDFCKICSKQARVDCYRKDPEKEIRANLVRDNRLNYLQTPSWADLDSISEFYRNTPKGHHVDHIIPLNGKLVSGLHVLSNLQYLTSEENLRKSNKYEP